MEKRNYYINFDGQEDHAQQYLLGMLADARLVTLSVVGHLTTEELDWQYQPGFNTIGALLDHIAAVEHYFRIEYVEGRTLTAAENEQLEPALDMGVHLPKLIGIKSLAEYMETLTTSRELMATSLAQVNFNDFTKTRPGYDEAEGCNLAWVLYHMVEDEIYHRGQINLLRKLYKH
jgi:uncharacterized damage-inducible protein DinB